MTEVLSPRVLLVNSPDDAVREMRKIGVSEGGIRAMTGKTQTITIKVAGACCPSAHVLKEQMLSLGGDAAVARDVITHKVETTDIILIGTHTQLSHLAEKLSYQPFGLPALGEELGKILETLSGKTSTVWRARDHAIDLGERARVMGILNVTPDSFSDGGHHLRPTAALDRALEMVGEGADIIDVGGQSSRPGSEPIPEKDELERVVPVVARIHEEWDGPISVDTWRAAVAEQAIAAGASIVNDITAFTAEPDTAAVTARHDAGCVLMHMQGTPATMQDEPTYDDLMGEITLFLRRAVEAAVAAGIAGDAIVVDPGIGFGKTVEHNLAILRQLPELSVLGKPILVGPSRKGFIGKVLDLPVDERLEGTLAAAAYAVAQGARIVRVHDVRAVVRAVRMVEACLSSTA
jgi:dihydropteroate synthase